MPKLLVSDYDGTIRRNQIVTEKDREAIHKFRAEGNQFAIATGRSIGMIVNELRHFEITYDFLIANNGGIIIDQFGGSIARYDIQMKTAMQLLSQLKQDLTTLIGISDGDRFGNIQDGRMEDTSSYQPLIDAAVTDAGDLLKAGKVNSFYVRASTNAKTKILFEALQSQYEGVLAFHYNNGTIDVSAPGVSKRTAVEKLAKRMSFDHKYVYAIGDGHNDMEMIQAFYGFSLYHAPDEVQRMAKEVVTTMDECICRINYYE